MQHRPDAEVAEDRLEARIVARIGVNERHALAADGLDAGKDFDLAVGEAVEDNQLVAARQQFDADMGADVAGAAGDEQMPAGHALLSATRGGDTSFRRCSHCGNLDVTTGLLIIVVIDCVRRYGAGVPGIVCKRDFG